MEILQGWGQDCGGNAVNILVSISHVLAYDVEVREVWGSKCETIGDPACL